MHWIILPNQSRFLLLSHFFPLLMNDTKLSKTERKTFWQKGDEGIWRGSDELKLPQRVGV
jgi:hypothetical protein